MTELLLPAGNLEKLAAAYDYGADAVYAGLPRYSLRARNNEFRLEQLADGIQLAHARQKKFYVTCNILPHNDKVRSFLRQLQPVIDLCPDALIMADPGLILLTRENWPHIPIHLSVQANTLNHASVRFWQQIGVRRIILSRELSLDEIADIRQTCPDIELEVFVHGALCIAYSGRCLLSGYFNRRDPNQGTCTNACRWNYSVKPANADDEQSPPEPLQSFNFNTELQAAESQFSATGLTRHPKAEQIYLIEEEQRPGEWMPVEEDEHGTYIMNSRDLRAVEHVERLVRIGVDSLKVEGRTKSLYYVVRTAQIYRQALDDALQQRPFNPQLIQALDSLANRGYTSGFLQRHTTDATQNYDFGNSRTGKSQYVGQVLRFEADRAVIDVKNYFQLHDELEIIHPSGNVHLFLNELYNQEGQPINKAPGNGILVQIPLPAHLQGALIARLLPEDAAAAPTL